MSKKTERKNKTNLVVKWPTTSLFTIDDIFQLNSEAKEITLRVRLTKEIESGRAAELGSKTGGQGRPRKVFAFTPVPQTTLDLAKSQNITLVDQNRLQKLFTVPSITSFVPRSQPVTA